MKSSSNEDMDLTRIFGRRGPPKKNEENVQNKPKVVATERIDDVQQQNVIKKTSSERLVEDFLNNKPQKKKSQDGLDFLTLDDIPNIKPKKKQQLSSFVTPKKQPVVRNAEFLI